MAELSLSPMVETRPCSGQVYDLMRLNPGQRSYLRSVASQCTPPFPMLMHPFFDLHGMHSFDGLRLTQKDIILYAIGEKELSEKQLRLLNAGMYPTKSHNPGCYELRYNERQSKFTPGFGNFLLELVSFLKTNPRMLILAEPAFSLPETIRTIRGLGFQNDIVYYETEVIGPLPKDYAIYTNKETYIKMEAEGYRLLAEAFHDIGINDFLIGGQYLEFDGISLGENGQTGAYELKHGSCDEKQLGHLARCVGAIMRNLYLYGFNFKVSIATFPQSHP